MRGKISRFLAALTVFIFLFPSNLVIAENSVSQVDGMEKVAENDKYELYYDKNSTFVSVVVKETGKVWSTNPDQAYIDSVGNDSVKISLKSQLEMKFYNKKEKEFVFNNFEESISKGQFTIEKLSDGSGIEIVYQVGRLQSMMIVPEVMRVKEFEELLSKMEEGDRNKILKQYSILNYESIPEKQRDDTVKKFPLIIEEDLYVSRKLAVRDKVKFDVMFSGAGLTVERMLENYEEMGYETEEEAYPLFNVPVIYKLTEKGLSAEVALDRIEYDEKNFKLTQISFLKLFGASSSDEDGYIFVPDGSGSIINRKDSSPYSFFKMIYGLDNAYKMTMFTEYSNPAVLPVFGMKEGVNAFLAMIESGEASSFINANTRSNATGLSNVSVLINYRDRETFMLSNIKHSELAKISKQHVQANLKIHYQFLTGNDANYSGMARTFRDNLFAEKPTLEKTDNIPFILESIGSISKYEKVFGLTKLKDVPVTTFEQAGKIVDELSNLGVKNITYKYSNWANGSAGSDYMSKGVSVNSVSGGKKELKNLLTKFENSGVEFYPNMDFMHFTKNKAFDNFVEVLDNTKHLGGESAFTKEYRPDTLGTNWRKEQYVLSPHKLVDYVSKFAKNTSKLGLSNISVSTLGSTINSDFSGSNTLTRPASQEKSVKSLEAIKEQNMKIGVDVGNAYSLAFADVVFDVPATSSGYKCEIRSVPFLQIVMHGYVDFASEPFNLATDYDFMELKAAEHGSSIHYLLNYAEDSVFKNTMFARFYSTYYQSWIEIAEKQYTKLNAEINDVYNIPIYEHNELKKDVYETVYEDGSRIIVNYSEVDYLHKASGTTISARDYKRITE